MNKSNIGRDMLLRATDKAGNELGFISVVAGRIFVLLNSNPGTEVASMEDALEMIKAPRCRRCGEPISEACHNDEC